MSRLVALLLMLPALAYADELVIHGMSLHSAHNADERVFDHQETRNGQTYNIYMVTKRYNNANFGIGYRINGVIFGLYNNSYNRPTAYIGRQYMLNKHVGGFIALGTGYDAVTHTPVTVLGGLVLKAALTDTISVELVGLPKLGKADSVIHTSIVYKLNL